MSRRSDGWDLSRWSESSRMLACLCLRGIGECSSVCVLWCDSLRPWVRNLPAVSQFIGVCSWRIVWFQVVIFGVSIEISCRGNKYGGLAQSDTLSVSLALKLRFIIIVLRAMEYYCSYHTCHRAGHCRRLARWRQHGGHRWNAPSSQRMSPGQQTFHSSRFELHWWRW